MVTVPMTDDGPDMNAVEALIDSDPTIHGMWWCRSTRTRPARVFGCRCGARARSPKRASPRFLVMWDNAYAVHDLEHEPQACPVLEAFDCGGHRRQRGAIHVDVEDHVRRRRRRIHGRIGGEPRRDPPAHGLQQHRPGQGKPEAPRRPPEGLRRRARSHGRSCDAAASAFRRGARHAGTRTRGHRHGLVEPATRRLFRVLRHASRTGEGSGAPRGRGGRSRPRPAPPSPTARIRRTATSASPRASRRRPKSSARWRCSWCA